MRVHAYVKARFARDAQRGPLENTRLQPLAEPCNVTSCNVTGLGQRLETGIFEGATLRIPREARLNVCVNTHTLKTKPRVAQMT